MKDLLCSILIAFSMYSKIPLPRVEWTEGRLKHVFTFFPLVGAIEGLLFYILWTILMRAGFSPFFYGACLTAFTYIYTGGIHMDGFLDVSDALASYREKEERLRILKDPHVGSFAVINAVLLILIETAAYSEIIPEMLPMIGITLVLSRSLSALSILIFPEAKKSGLAYSFKESSEKSVKILLYFYVVICFAAALFISPKYGATLIIISAILYIYHYLNSVKNFGGVSGDLAGHFLTLYECLVPFVIVALSHCENSVLMLK